MQLFKKTVIAVCVMLMMTPLIGLSQDAKVSMDQLFPARVTGLLQTNASWTHNQTALQNELNVIYGALPMLSKLAYYGNEERIVQLEILFADSKYIKMAKEYHKNPSVTTNEILLRMSQSLMGKREIGELLEYDRENGNYSGLMSGDIGRRAIAFRFLSDQSILVVSTEIKNQANDNGSLEMVRNFIQSLNTTRMSEVMNFVEDYYSTQFTILEELVTFSSLPVQMIFTEEHRLEQLGQFFETQFVFANSEAEVEKENGEMVILMANVACNKAFFNTRSQMFGLMDYFDESTRTGTVQNGFTVHKLEISPGSNLRLIYYESEKINYLFMAPAGGMSISELDRFVNHDAVRASHTLNLPCK